MKKEILLANYWEHFKFAKELSAIYSIDNPKRLRVEAELNDIQKQLDSLK